MTAFLISQALEWMTSFKKIYMLKREREEHVASSPKTPAKKTPYKDMFVAAAPFVGDRGNSSVVDGEPVSSDVFVHTERDGTEELSRCSFVCKTGEGAYYEVFANRKSGRENREMEEPAMLYKSRSLCIYDDNYTAVKKSKKRISGDLDRQNRMREVEMLRRISSAYVTKYCDFWESRGYLFLELEYCSIGTLRDYINEIYFLKKSRFAAEITKKMMYELASGLEAIHACDIVHLDLKPENILLKSVGMQTVCTEECHCPFPVDPESFVFKISDFNISRYEGEEIDDDGDKRYMAPEVLRNVCTKASDVYSLGLVYLEIIAGIILPKSGDSWMRLRKNDFRGVKLDRVCKLMLDMNYRKRLSAAEVREMFV